MAENTIKEKEECKLDFFSYIGLTVSGSLGLTFPLSSLKPLHLEICLVGRSLKIYSGLPS
jgi:hypothetical protein